MKKDFIPLIEKTDFRTTIKGRSIEQVRSTTTRTEFVKDVPLVPIIKYINVIISIGMVLSIEILTSTRFFIKQ
jgi:hypothetical protein